MNNYPTCLAFTLRQEGGWSNNANDTGGCTMEGITISTYQNWKNDNTLTCADLHGISSDEVYAIYQQNYWSRVQGDKLPNGVDLMVFDMAVNAGVGGSAKLLQACVGVAVDGAIGSHTLAAIDSIDPVKLINSLAQRQGDYYESLPGFQYFGAGWLNRVNARHAAALSMAANAHPIVHAALPVAQRVAASDTPPDNFFRSIF